jgi:hypothetical protein
VRRWNHLEAFNHDENQDTSFGDQDTISLRVRYDLCGDGFRMYAVVTENGLEVNNHSKSSRQFTLVLVKTLTGTEYCRHSIEISKALEEKAPERVS